MLLGEVKKRLEAGEDILVLVAEAGIGQNKFRDILKLVGFQYQGKRWFFRGDKEELNRSVEEYDKKYSASEIQKMLKVNPARITNSNTSGNIKPYQITNSNIIGNTKRITEGNKPGNSLNLSGNTIGNTYGNPFTIDEVEALQKLAKASGSILALLNQKEAPQAPTESLKRKISENVGNTIKKTFVIEEETAKRLDRFAEQTGFTKSDLLTVAVRELLDKYNR